MRVAVVGLGFGAVHVQAFRRDARCEVVALCGRDEHRTKALAERLQVPRAVVDFRKLFEPGVADAIALAVPAPVQAELGRAALQAGKHVLFEKPRALSVADADALRELALERNLTTAINFEFPENAAWRETKRRVEAGELGRLRHVALRWHVETYANKLRLESWKTRSIEGGGAMNLFTSHVFYNLEWLFGPLRSISAAIARAPHDRRETDTLNALHCTTAAGLPIAVHVAIDSFLGDGHRLEIYGDEGTLFLENRSADYINGFELRIGTRATGELRTIDRGPSPRSDEDGRIEATARVASRFLSCISNRGEPMVPGARERARVARLAEAAYRAQAERRTLEID